MKKKMLFMISKMDVGGIEKSFLSLLSVLPKEKYDITVMFLSKEGGFLKAIPDWVNIEEVDWFEDMWDLVSTPPPNLFRKYIKSGRYIKAFCFGLTYFLSRELKQRSILYRHFFKMVPENKNEYDIAIAYQGPTEIIDYYILNRVKAKKKISWIHFDVSKFIMDQALYEKLYRQFDKIYAVSKEAKKCMVERFPHIKQKTEVFLNIVSKQLVNDMSQLPVEFDKNYQGIKIVTVARVSSEKGQDMSVRALARLRRDGYDVKWYCIGGIENEIEYKKLKNLIQEEGVSDSFIFLGAKLNPYPYIKQADLYVQPSRHEGYCIALAEARCLGKPIIATNFIGAFEQIIHAENGYIVDTNEEAIYRKIKFLLDNPLQMEYIVNNLSQANIDTTTEADKLINYV